MKTVLITGASRGIGKALAERFLQEGYFVIGTSRSGSSDFEHENLAILPLELSEPQSIDMCAEQIKVTGRKIDVFVNNAGIWDPRDDREEIEDTVLRDTLEANLLGPIHFSENVVPLLNRNSHVINISSRRGSCDFTEDTIYPCYSISKAGINMYTRKLAARLKGETTVSCVHPGSVQTDMNPEGEISAQEAAKDIFRLATSDVETGQFWFKGERFPW